MKVLLIFVDVEQLLDASGVPGYTRFPDVLGQGQTGRKLGSRAFPGSSALFFVALPDGRCAGLCDALEALRTAKGPEEGLRAFMLDATQVL